MIMYKENLGEQRHILKRSKHLIKKGWCQKSYARDKDGKPISFLSKKAVSFCLSGAISRAASDLPSATIYRTLNLVRANMRVVNDGGELFVAINDNPFATKEKIIDLLTKTQKALKEVK